MDLAQRRVGGEPVEGLADGHGIDVAVVERDSFRGAAERRDTVRLAVAALDEPYREVVAMRFFADMSLERIAAGTGRPLGTVKAQLHRGLERLRRSMTSVAR